MNNWSPEVSGQFLGHYGTLRGVVRQTLIDRQLAQHIAEPPARVCDVGGGAGHQVIPLARRGYGATILEPSEEMLRGARQTLANEREKVRARMRLVTGYGEDAPVIFGKESFEAVLCHGVLIYLDNPDPLIEALSAIARPGAVISILTKNADAPRYATRANGPLQRRPGRIRLGPRDEPPRIRYKGRYSPGTLREAKGVRHRA